MEFLFDYAAAFAFFLVGILFAAFNWGVGILYRPKNPTAAKLTAYECGEPTVGDSWGKFNIRTWTVAIVFVIFDVEAVFLFPIAFNLKAFQAEHMGWLAFGELLCFLTVLAVGLWYVWYKGDLNYAWPASEDRTKLPEYVPFEPEEEEYHPPVAAHH